MARLLVFGGMGRGSRALSAIAVAGLLAAAGCGSSGGGAGSTTKGIEAQTITAPTTTSAGGTSGATGSTATTPPTIPLPGGGRIRAAALVPFRDCMQRHGGDVRPFGGGQSNRPDAIRSRFQT